MQIDLFNLYLFDFDGILVDTENLHYQAYKEMCKHYGHELSWDMKEYLQAAMFSQFGLRDAIYERFPRMQELPWDKVYSKKLEIYLEIVETYGVKLMPGVEALLKKLFKLNKKIAVVTNSTSSQVEALQNQHPILQQIPYWMTRECYIFSKPNGECYQKAIEKWQHSGDEVIGFEDSYKGMQALLNVRAHSVFVSPFFDLTLWKDQPKKPSSHFASLEALVQ